MGGPSHFSPGTGRSKGLITLFNPKFKEYEIKLIFKSDRILISSILIDKCTIFIVNIYAPCIEQEKSFFLNKLYNEIKHNIGAEHESSIICLGDFNIALQNLDVVKGEQHKDFICNEFRNFIQRFGSCQSKGSYTCTLIKHQKEGTKWPALSF